MQICHLYEFYNECQTYEWLLLLLFDCTKGCVRGQVTCKKSCKAMYIFAVVITLRMLMRVSEIGSGCLVVYVVYKRMEECLIHNIFVRDYMEYIAPGCIYRVRTIL